MVIRFPKDIADQIHKIPEEVRGSRFEISFIDERHAEVNLFGEFLKGIILDLPTSIETHRTNDSFHLYKSGDITKILLVYRGDEPDPDLVEGFQMKHGITPPTKNIVTKEKHEEAKKRRKQRAKGRTPYDTIDYWDEMELELAKNTMKPEKLGKIQKTICRHEYLTEPDVDPVILEKVLRRNGMKQYTGYSMTHIPDSDIESEDETPEPEPELPMNNNIPSEEPTFVPEDEPEVHVVEEVPQPVAMDTSTSSMGEIEDDEEEEENLKEFLEHKLQYIGRQIETKTRILATTSNALLKRRTEQQLGELMNLKLKYEEDLEKLM